MRKAPKIMIVDDHKMLRQGLILLLKQYDFQIIYEADNGRHAVELLKEIEPNVILMDILMPVMNGVEALKIIKRKYPLIKIIMLTGLYDNLYLSETIARGADTFLPKNCNVDELVNAIKTICNNEHFIYGPIRKVDIKSSEKIDPAIIISQEALTAKEIEILLSICKGESRKMMARKFNITTRTIRYHTYNVYKKTKFMDRDDLIRYAIKNGYLTFSELD